MIKKFTLKNGKTDFLKEKYNKKHIDDPITIMIKGSFLNTVGTFNHGEWNHLVAQRNKGATEFTRVCLSFPFDGEKLTTGIPIFLNSSVRG